MTPTHLDPSDRPTVRLLALGSVLAVLVVGLATLVQATPSGWRLLLVPLAVLPVVTLRRPLRELLLPDEPWQPTPLPAVAPVYDLQAARALRYGWVDADGPRAA